MINKMIFLANSVTLEQHRMNFPTTDSSRTESFRITMSEITLSDKTIYKFGNLAKICKILLVYPHGNVDPEHLFSMVSKIETDQQSSLLPSTVANLISVKVSTSSEWRIYVTRIYVTCGVWHGIYVTCKVDSTAEDYAKQRIYVTWGVARNLRKSSIVTSLQADSRAPDDGRMNFGAFPPKVQ